MTTDLNEPDLDHPPRRGLRHATGNLLPTLATLGNLVCGFASIYYAARGAAVAGGATSPSSIHTESYFFQLAGWMIFLAMVFDALDGRLARIARATSDLGAQLDSLADVVSFGAAPAFLMLQLLVARLGEEWFKDNWIGTESGVVYAGRAVWVVGALFACCAALRLARFNVETTADESAHMWFKGLPTPGAAAALASLALLLEQLVGRASIAPWMVRTVFWTLPPVALAAALMMVSNVPYPHAFNHFIRRRHPFRNLVLALLVGGLLMVFKLMMLAVASVGYALCGPLLLAYRRLLRRDVRTPDELAEALINEEDEPAEGE